MRGGREEGEEQDEGAVRGGREEQEEGVRGGREEGEEQGVQSSGLSEERE